MEYIYARKTGDNLWHVVIKPEKGYRFIKNIEDDIGDEDFVGNAAVKKQDDEPLFAYQDKRRDRITALGDKRIKEALLRIVQRSDESRAEKRGFFVTKEQYDLLKDRVKLRVAEGVDYFVHFEKKPSGKWIVIINRFMVEDYHKELRVPKWAAERVFITKLAYLLARQLDHICFEIFSEDKHLEPTSTEEVAVILLRETAWLNAHRDDGKFIVEFANYLHTLRNRGTARRYVTEPNFEFEHGYEGLIGDVYGGKFYALGTFIGEMRWLELIREFIEDNLAYYQIRLLSQIVRGLGIAIDFLLENIGLSGVLKAYDIKSAIRAHSRSMRSKDILRYLRWYENYINYWLCYARSTTMRFNKKTIPYYHANLAPNDSLPYLPSTVIGYLAEPMPEDKRDTFLQASLRSIHDKDIPIDDIDEICLRYLKAGSHKDAYYVMVFTAEGPYDFVVWLQAPDPIETDDYTTYVELLEPGEMEALEWANIQYSRRTPKLGVRLPGRKDKYGLYKSEVMSVSYMGRDLRMIVSKDNTKMRDDVKVEFLRAGLFAYAGGFFRMGGFTLVDDVKPENETCLDLRVGIVDYGRTRAGEIVYNLSCLIKAGWGYLISPHPAWQRKVWDIPPYTNDKSYILDAVVDVFNALPPAVVAERKINMNYRVALGIDTLQEILQDPYEILPADVKAGLRSYLQEVLFRYKPARLFHARSLVEEADWEHVNKRFHEIEEPQDVSFEKKMKGGLIVNPYWFLAQRLRLPERITSLSKLTHNQVLNLLDYMMMDYLPVTSNEYLTIIKILSSKYKVRLDGIRRKEEYRATIRTLRKQAEKAVHKREIKTATRQIVEFDADLILGLSRRQVENILRSLAELPEDFTPALGNPHIGLRKEEVVLSSVLKWLPEHESPGSLLYDLAEQAMGRFVSFQEPVTRIGSRPGITHQEAVDNAVRDNIARLLFIDEQEVKEARDYAGKKDYIVEIGTYERERRGLIPSRTLL
ncbi:MAG: hypothetical protein JRI96_17145, partial [Deltaproteobacteria bacterium]|nr:hypothetical protein [Deltaproteobacteria bacterium]